MTTNHTGFNNDTIPFPKREAAVLFHTEQTDCGHKIGIMNLNRQKSINAMSVEMCKLL